MRLSKNLERACARVKQSKSRQSIEATEALKELELSDWRACRLIVGALLLLLAHAKLAATAAAASAQAQPPHFSRLQASRWSSSSTTNDHQLTNRRLFASPANDKTTTATSAAAALTLNRSSAATAAAAVEFAPALISSAAKLAAARFLPASSSSHRVESSSSSVINHAQAGSTEQQDAVEQEARSMWSSLPNRPSLFSVIRFPNEECFDSSNQSGTCYTAFECKLLGGQPSSPCAAGFGSCCIVSRTCHVTTREKVIYFKNPSYPSADSDEKFCDLTVEMSDLNVCQIRLDFLDFQLDPPTNGACKDDYMEISASGMPPQTVPRLCGLNRNQHRK